MILLCGAIQQKMFLRGEQIIQILLQAGFAVKRSKVKGPAQEIQFLGVKWQDGRRHIPMDVVDKITAMSSPTNKKETQSFLGIVGFWRMHVPNYSLIVSPLYQVTWKKNDFTWGPERQQAFEKIKQEIARAMTPGASTDRTGCKEHPLRCCWRERSHLEFVAKNLRGDPRPTPGVEHTGGLKSATLQLRRKS